jgi:hypothetical protein
VRKHFEPRERFRIPETDSDTGIVRCFVSSLQNYILILIVSPERVLFTFLERYLLQLEESVALQVWNRYLQLAKDIVGGLRDNKALAYPTLRYEILGQPPCAQTLIT